MHQMTAKLAPALMICMLSITAAQAQSLKQRELIAKDKGTVAEHLADANKTCGSHVTLTTDYSTFADVTTSADNPNQQSPWAFIVNTTDAMDALCRSSPEAKSAIQTKLKSIMVSHAATESYTFANGTLHYAVPYSGASYHNLMNYLRDTL